VKSLTDGRSLPAETLARTVTVRPDSSTIHYASDDFSVNETLFVPIHEPGALVMFEVETIHPLEIEAAFERDFQLEWPAGLGATYVKWAPELRAFTSARRRVPDKLRSFAGKRVPPRTKTEGA
jgi:hypothetical protein